MFADAGKKKTHAASGVGSLLPSVKGEEHKKTGNNNIVAQSKSF